jgi:aspartyl-tRNA(Asn)/glutamyl-tRNA(Gln) amidotransferase subunit A
VVLGAKTHPVRGPGSGSVSRNTSPSNSTGLPAISVPCGFTSSGLPIGLQLIGRPFDEALLLQIAHAYEAVSPARGCRPRAIQRK